MRLRTVKEAGYHQAAVDVAAHVKGIIQNGFTIFDRLVEAEAVKLLRSSAGRNRVPGDLFISGQELIEEQPDTILPIIGSSRVLGILENVIGPFVQLDSVSLVGVAVGCPADISWHRDPYGSIPRGDEFQRPLAMNLLVYLQDLEADVGPLRVIPGSHRSGLVMDAAERARPHPEERLIYARAGDAVLIHNNLVHSRTRNTSRTDRLHLSVIYNLTCMRSVIDLASPQIQEIVQELLDTKAPPKYLRLFGLDRNANERYNSGFLNSDEETWARWTQEEGSALDL
jgi:hypothetical protein